MSSGAGWSVRPARTGDAEQIARVHSSAWRETYAGVLSEQFFEDAAHERRRGMWTALLADPPSSTTIAIGQRQDGRIVGFATSGDARGTNAEHGFAPARPLHLFTIYVLAAEHGTGLGQALLDAVLGNRPAQLWVLRGNARAIAFYQRNGFRADGVEFADPRDPNLVELRLIR